MKGLLKAVVLTAAVATSTQAFAYTDIMGNYFTYSLEEIRKTNVEDLKTDLDKFEYALSKTEFSYDRGQETQYTKELMPSTYVELEELHQKGFTPASLILAELEIGKINRDCEDAANRAKCKSVISPKVVGYLTPVANEDESGKGAAALSDYYRSTYSDEGRELAREWASIARDKIDSFREEWRETGERPKPTFMLTDEEKKAKEESKSFFSW